jgi:hypothetical protein
MIDPAEIAWLLQSITYGLPCPFSHLHSEENTYAHLLRLYRKLFFYFPKKECLFVDFKPQVRLEVFTVVTMKDTVFWVLLHAALVRADVLEECQFLQEPHGITSQKMAFFIAHVCLSSYLAFGVLYPFM